MFLPLAPNSSCSVLTRLLIHVQGGVENEPKPPRFLPLPVFWEATICQLLELIIPIRQYTF